MRIFYTAGNAPNGGVNAFVWRNPWAWPGNLASQDGCGRFPEGFSKMRVKTVFSPVNGREGTATVLPCQI